MSTAVPPPAQSGRARLRSIWPLLVSLLLFLLFAGLVIHQLRANRPHQVTDADLLGQLAEAEFLDEEPAPAPLAGEWPQWRGVHRDGVVQLPRLLTQWPTKGPKHLWEQDAAKGYSSLAVAGNRAYTLLRPENGDEVVVCWQVDPFKELWRQTYEAYAGDVDYGNWPRSTPTLDGDRLYTVSTGGRFQCRDAGTGELRWEHDLIKEYKGAVPKWGFAFSPLVHGDLVYATPGCPGGASVIAFNKESGQEVWKALDDPPGYSSPITITVAGATQVVVFTGNSLVGLTAKDGRLLWRYPWETAPPINVATPLAFRTRNGDQTHQYLFISSGYKKGCALLQMAADQQGGFHIRSVFENDQLCCHYSSPVRYKDHVYGFNESLLTCMDLRTGEVRWTKSGYRKGSLIRADRYLIVLGEEGHLALGEANPDPEKKFRPAAEARPLGRPTAGNHCWTPPALARGLLFLRDLEKVVCLDLRP